ncbi:choice-of-anchor Q domain-containing protein [Thiocapsa rosea]|uniref:Parallel beta helix pectate lyase-like protein n=1 Tax=Thiocapsa rosea TaxID=69360 RepID=A0A495V6Y9_9GAMM|nr:choice-of-anchor Q domain-containing protein [Thiocapsa rosea]RKT44470.1 parallel beta helix pectate lyase-like protein [Thiocapsa rosea]
MNALRSRRPNTLGSRLVNIAAVLAISAASLTLLPTTAHAATFTVTNLNDSGLGSLRQAIRDANANVQTGADTIRFQAGLRGDIVLLTQLPSISRDLNIVGPGADTLTIFPNRQSDGLVIRSDRTVTISGLRITNARIGVNNDGILTVNNCEISGNFSSGLSNRGYNARLTLNRSLVSENRGRGINNEVGGSLIVNESTLVDNITTSSFGGGGIYSSNSATMLTVINSTLNGNSAPNGPGGGVTMGSANNVTFYNNTLSGNTAERGGALSVSGGLAVANSTITGNLATREGGGIYVDGVLFISNSIVAGNRTTAMGNTGIEIIRPSTRGTFTSRGYNLFGQNGVSGLTNVTPSAGDLILSGSIATAVVALSNNGGPTRTHLPVSGGPAVNGGSNSLIPAGVGRDQRGAPRVTGGNVDIGSVELGVPPRADHVGLHNPGAGAFFLRYSHSGGAADASFRFGPSGSDWRPLTGDWNGNGQDTVGLYDPARGVFYLRNTIGGGVADLSFGFGPSGRAWRPLSGDWNGNGRAGVGLYDPATGSFFLRNTLGGGAADYGFRFGPAGRNWIPLSGDWDGDGRTTIGLYDPLDGTFHLRNSLSGGVASVSFRFGPAGRNWVPLSGDWNGDGQTTIGLYDPVSGSYYLRNRLSGGTADLSFRFGPAPSSWTPLSGTWQLPGTAGNDIDSALLEAADALNEDAALPFSRALDPSELPTSLQTRLTEAQAEARDAYSGADGGWIVFVTDTALVAEDTNGTTDVYGYDPLADTLALVSRGTDGRAGNGASFGAHLDGAGMRMVFVSEASNLVADDINGAADVFLYEAAFDHIHRISRNSFGEAADGASRAARLSADGRHVAFVSAATNLAEDSLDGGEALFAHELASGLTQRIELD